MKIVFLWDWEPDYYQALTWQDGLAAAIKELMKRGHVIQVITCRKSAESGMQDFVIKNPLFEINAWQPASITKYIQAWKPAVILHWADMTRPSAKRLIETNIPQAICFAGGDPISYNTDIFAHIFVESQVYEDEFREKGYPVSRAFGTNTSLFKPVEQAKSFDTIFPATFATWKRHSLYGEAVRGLRALACGYMYTNHEQECWQDCVKQGVTILPHVSAETLKYLYAASRVCVVPTMSMGGSQRTVLEAMAMNLPLVITDSDRFDFARGRVFEAEPDPENIRQMIGLALDSEVNTRDYVVEQWSEFTYADALEEGLLKLLS